MSKVIDKNQCSFVSYNLNEHFDGHETIDIFRVVAIKQIQ